MSNILDRAIRYYDVREKKETTLLLIDCFVYIAVDPSGGSSEATATRRTDKCGWAVGAVDMHDNRFILEIGEKHFDDEQFVDHIYSLYDQYIPKVIGIEKTPHLLSHFRHIEKQKKKVLPITELKPLGRKKEVRIRSAGTTLGRTYFIDTERNSYEQLFRKWYTDMEHGDDGLDAFSYLDDIIIAPTEEQLQSHRNQILKLLAELYVEQLPKEAKEDWAFVKRFTQQDSYSEDWDRFMRGH